jgi:hypothetical protein
MDEGFSVNPYDGHFETYYKRLSSIGKYFNIRAVHEDVEFISKFIDINDRMLPDIFENGDTSPYYDNLVIPSLKTYELNYTVWGSCSYEDFLSQEIDSYDIDWVKDSAHQMIDDGNWNTYEGRNIRETEYDNFDESDFSFDKVILSKDKNVIDESLSNRILVEHTRKSILSLDRKNLLRLKAMINSRLESL